MAKYTVQLRSLCKLYGRETIESWFSDYELSDYLTREQIETIENAGLWTKEKLAKKIVNHYQMYEIGVETDNLFRDNAKNLMNEIMEEYLPLIYSKAIYYDPLVNVDYTESFTRNVNGSGTSTSSASGLNVNSDTPQGQIDKEEILRGRYASSTGASETAGSVSDSSNTNENYSKRVVGNSGVSATAQKMIEQYRNNIVAIDKDIIKELNILFMGIF